MAIVGSSPPTGPLATGLFPDMASGEISEHCSIFITFNSLNSYMKSGLFFGFTVNILFNMPLKPSEYIVN